MYQREPKTVEEAGKAAMAFEMFQAPRPSKTPFLPMQYGQPTSRGGHPSDQDDSIKQLLDRMTLLEQGQMKSTGSTGQSMSSPQLTPLANRLEKLEKAQQGGAAAGRQASGQSGGKRDSGRRPVNCNYCGILDIGRRSVGSDRGIRPRELCHQTVDRPSPVEKELQPGHQPFHPQLAVKLGETPSSCHHGPSACSYTSVWAEQSGC